MGYLQKLKKLLSLEAKPVQQSSRSVLVLYDHMRRENDRLRAENDTFLENRRKRKNDRRNPDISKDP